jgi:tetratricopeptide (TPR) repeat protein
MALPTTFRCLVDIRIPLGRIDESLRRMTSLSEKKGDPAIASSWYKKGMLLGFNLALAFGVVLIFGQTGHHGFINYDDNDYVYENPQVSKGLTPEGIHWAFTSSHAHNWHPLTWLSHMLDVELYGLDPSGHHRTSVVFHALNAVLLFWLVRLLTGSIGPSAFVAAVFAVHPLRVESVAWIAERKDVLSGFFFLLTLLAYVRYARLPWSPWRYGLVLFLFAAGLMAKPMLVPLPLILLLLDFWPLRRLEHSKAWKLFREKIPLLFLSLISIGLTLSAQRGAVVPLDFLPLPLRLGNALETLFVYLRQTVYPVGLAVFYPFPEKNPAPVLLLGMAAVLLLAFAGTWILRRSHPYLLVGLLWYLVLLMPVLGIVQVGIQAHADRYTYLPLIGPVWAITWLAAEVLSHLRKGQWIGIFAAFGILAVLLVLARGQASYWRDSESLWTQTAAHTRPHARTHNHLAIARFQKGDLPGGILHLQKALQIHPDSVDARYNLGRALALQGNTAEAVAQYTAALAIHGQHIPSLNNLAWIFASHPDAAFRNGNRAVTLAEEAVQLSGGEDPLYLDTLAGAYAEAGKFPEAIATAEKALRLEKAAGKSTEPLERRLQTYRSGKPVRE